MVLLQIAGSSSLIDDAFTFALVAQYTERGSTQIYKDLPDLGNPPDGTGPPSLPIQELKMLAFSGGPFLSKQLPG